MTPRELRMLMPATRRWVYLNAAASSPLATPVATALSELIDEMTSQADADFGRWVGRKEGLRARLANFVGASADSVAFTPSTSMGMTVAGAALRQRGIEEVVTYAGEFPSSTLPLLHQGLLVRAARSEPDGSVSLRRLEAALTPRTGAIVLSIVQFASGYRVDLPGVAALCRRRGLRLVLNAAQALGHVPIDLRASGADFLAATSHKWMMGGYGAGILVATPEALEGVRLPWAGWLSVDQPMEMRAIPPSSVVGGEQGDPEAPLQAAGLITRRELASLEAGAGAWLPLVGLEAALRLHEELGIHATWAHILGLQRLLREKLRRSGFAPNAPDDPACVSGICVVPVEPDPQEAARALRGEGVLVSTRGGGLRVSTHAFNDDEDVERLLRALNKLAIRPKATGRTDPSGPRP